MEQPHVDLARQGPEAVKESATQPLASLAGADCRTGNRLHLVPVPTSPLRIMLGTIPRVYVFLHRIWNVGVSGVSDVVPCLD